MVARARKASGTTRRTTKKLPKEVWSTLGPIPVIETDDLEEDTLGSFNLHERVIRIRTGLQQLQRDQVLKHEWVHAVLWDTGLYNALDPALEEQICDAIATALVASTL